jgi:hypothetical protein
MAIRCLLYYNQILNILINSTKAIWDEYATHVWWEGMLTHENASHSSNNEYPK